MSFQSSSALCSHPRRCFFSSRARLLRRNICWQRATALTHLSGTCSKVAVASPPVAPGVNASDCVVRLRHRQWRLQRLLLPVPRPCVHSACPLSHISSTARSGADVGPASPLTRSVPVASTMSTRTISPLWNSLRASPKALPACASTRGALSKSAAAERSGSLDVPFPR